jgi:membrane fusion protein (multidrug efflux system)
MNCKKTGILLLAVLVMAVLPMVASENIKAECPKKVAVVLETVKASVFMEYQYFSGQGQAEIVAVTSPVSGLLSEIKVSEGSLVDAGQELAIMNSGMSDEIKKLEAAVAKAKKILTARQNWKDKNEQAIQSATKDYQKTLDLLNKKKAQTSQIIKAPLAGIVHLVMAVGTETGADALLFEISNPRQMIFQISLAESDKGSLAMGDIFIGMTDGSSAEVEAKIVAVSDNLVAFRVNNNENQVKEGISYTFKKLKAEHTAAIVIPGEAIQKDSLGDFVYVAEKKKAKKLYLTLGAAANGKTMVTKGLDADTLLIVSGLECLADGKAIRIVNQEELAKEKAEVKVKEVKTTVRKEKKVVEPEIKTRITEEAEKIGEAQKNRYILGVTFERFTINDKNMREYYSNWFQHIPGLEISYQAVDKIDIWASAKYYTVKRSTDFFEDIVRFTLIPFSLGVRFRPIKSGSFEPFVGAGINVYYYAETITGVAALENTSGLAFGFHGQGGTYFYFGPSFLKSIFSKHNRSLLGEIFVKYNIVNKTLAEALPEEEGNKINLGGFEMGLGLAVKF